VAVSEEDIARLPANLELKKIEPRLFVAQQAESRNRKRCAATAIAVPRHVSGGRRRGHGGDRPAIIGPGHWRQSDERIEKNLARFLPRFAQNARLAFRQQID